MKRLITFELRKLFRTISFYICLAIPVVLIFLNALLAKSMADSSGVQMDPASSILNFTSNGMLTMILGIFTAIFVTEDYVGGTIKNIIAKGYSRNEVYFAKYIVSIISTLVFLAVSLMGSFLISSALFHGDAVENNTYIISLVLEFLLVLAYNSLFFVISIASGKLGLSIAFDIIGPSMVGLLLTLADSFLKLDKFNFSDYWLDSCLSSVQTVNCEQSAIVTSIIVAIVVLAASILLGLKLNSRKEF